MTTVQVDAPERFRARQSIPGDYLQTLLNSLTLENIREVIYTLAPTERIVVPNHASSMDAVLKTHRSTEEIVQCLLEVEGSMPFKHCTFMRCSGTPAAQKLESLVGKSLSNNGLSFRVVQFRSTPKDIRVTFEHYVEVHDWVSESDDVKKRITFVTRQPIVLKVKVSDSLCTLNYPGFSQGQGVSKGKQLDYLTVLSALVTSLGNINLSLQPVPVREALKVLLNSNSIRVRRVRTDIESASTGRFDISSQAQTKAVEESLADLLLPHMESSTRKDLVESAKRALNSADANYVILFWSPENVFTRLRFWDIGCEILFIWHGEQASYAIVEEIVTLLVQASTRVEKGPHSGAFSWVASRDVDSVIRPVDMLEKLDLSESSARAELIYAIRAGIVVPVYRLLTTLSLDESMNLWTENAADLKKVFHTAEGTTIDGTNPRCIEVGFRRIGIAE